LSHLKKNPWRKSSWSILVLEQPAGFFNYLWARMVCKHNDLLFIKKQLCRIWGFKVQSSKFKVQTPARKVASHFIQINK
jgi:hypothetical protein